MPENQYAKYTVKEGNKRGAHTKMTKGPRKLVKLNWFPNRKKIIKIKLN